MVNPTFLETHAHELNAVGNNYELPDLVRAATVLSAVACYIASAAISAYNQRTDSEERRP